MSYAFITIDYFNGPINIPNSASDRPEGAQLQEFINAQTPIFLYDILGYTFSNNLISEMAAYDTLNPENTNDKWLRLVFGATYQGPDGVTYKWDGLTTHVTSNGSAVEKYLSPIANFVYCKLREANSSTTTQGGEAVAKFENNSAASLIPKLTWAWNRMTEMNWNMHRFIMANISEYDSYDYIGQTYPPYEGQFRNISNNQNLFITI